MAPLSKPLGGLGRMPSNPPSEVAFQSPGPRVDSEKGAFKEPSIQCPKAKALRLDF